MLKTCFYVLALGLMGAACAGGGGPAFTSQPLTLSLGNTTSAAELLRPVSIRKAPLVLLIQGTGPEDMNGSFTTHGKTFKGSLGTLARTLAAQGFAVMRYDKRYAAATFNPQTAASAQASYAKLSLQDLLSDARTALNVARTQPDLDASKVFIYGWSEGSVVAANLALETKASGLIVQGPVVKPFAATFVHQFERVGIPYLTPYAKAGKIDLAGVMASFGGSGSGLARTQSQLLLALDSTPQHPKLNSIFDTDKDGKIDLKKEALPQLQALYPQFLAQSPLYAPATSLPVLGELAPRLTLPVLILQGRLDGNIDPEDAQQLSESLPGPHLLKLYSGLGHSLGPAASVTTDNFAPMAAAPMADFVSWLKQY